MDGRVWHYVKRNETTRVPRRHIFLDTEAWRTRDGRTETQRWACAVACYRSSRPDRPAQERWATYDDPALLWNDVERFCHAGRRTVLWTHNLGYDSRIADMFTTLPALGWRLVAHNLIGKGTWLIWRKNKTTLSMVDSASVFPTVLAKVGELWGLGKLPLPQDDTRGVGFFSRCWRDVEILRTAIVTYVDWLETEDLGNWQLTGAGQSFAAFRHRFMDKRLLVHDDGDALAAERRAMWTGRCEAYWHGELNFGQVHEWDLSLAYVRIAQRTPVPVRLLGPMPDDYPWQSTLDSTSTAVLAEVDITTEVPVVPTVHDGRILWPVGTFITTLWDVEIKAALQAGASVTLRRGWLYHKAPALRQWADWIIDQLHQCEQGVAAWRYPVLKHWSRALIGRFAMTYTRWEEYAQGPDDRVYSAPVYDADTGERFTIVQIGRTQWRDTGTVEWGHSMPMVTGYIQAVCRVILWEVLRTLPDRSVIYADTDSVLVPDIHHDAVRDLADGRPEWGLRLKRSWRGFAVWGPRQFRTGDLVRVAGVTRGAQRVSKMEFAGQVWETLPGALSRGHPDRVVIHDRKWTIAGKDRRRSGPKIGWTHPIELGGGNHDRDHAA